LRIGFISTAGNEIVPTIVRQFRELNAEVEFSLRNILTIDQIQMLEAGSLDIGFLRLPIGAHPELEVVTVHREPFVLVVPSSHKLARRKRVRLREASGQDFVMYERAYAPGFHDLIFGMLRDAGIIPNVRQTAGEMPTLISLVDSARVPPLFPVVLGSYRFESERNCCTVSRALIRSPKTTHQGQGRSNFDARSAQLATVFNGDGEY
jgi:DNA-binding transcriptional LysR family regulator